MIQLQSNYLVFRMSTGELLPCSAEAVTAELLGDTLNLIEPQTIQEALKAVVYYFREEHEGSSVSVDQFSSALGKVLQRSPFYVMISSRKPTVWWGTGLTKIQPVAKMRFVTTGRERGEAMSRTGGDWSLVFIQKQP